MSKRVMLITTLSGAAVLLEESTLGLLRKLTGYDEPEEHSVYNPLNLDIITSEETIEQQMRSLKSHLDSLQTRQGELVDKSQPDYEQYHKQYGLLEVTLLNYLRSKWNKDATPLSQAHLTIINEVTCIEYIQLALSISKKYMDEIVNTNSKTVLEPYRLYTITEGTNNEQGLKQGFGLTAYQMYTRKNGNRVFYAIFDFAFNGTPDIFVELDMDSGERLYVQFCPNNPMSLSKLPGISTEVEERLLPGGILYAENTKPRKFDKADLKEIHMGALGRASRVKEIVEYDALFNP